MEHLFTPNYSAAVLAAKMCANSNEHFMYIRFQWVGVLEN
jgi:hypothetical protein